VVPDLDQSLVRGFLQATISEKLPLGTVVARWLRPSRIILVGEVALHKAGDIFKAGHAYDVAVYCTSRHDFRAESFESYLVSGLFDLIYFGLDETYTFEELERLLKTALQLLDMGGVVWFDGYDINAALRRLVLEFVLGTGCCHAYVCVDRGIFLLQKLRKGF